MICLPQLFTVDTAFSGFHRHVPRAWRWQTDRQGDEQPDNKAPNDKMDKTRGECCPDRMGVNEKTSKGTGAINTAH